MVEIVAKSTHSEKRTRDFFKFHLFRVSPTRYIYFAVALVLFIMSVVFYFMVKYGSSLFFLFASLMVLVIRVVATNIIVSKVLKKVVYPAINYKLVFNENGIIHSYDLSKFTYRWNEFKIIYEIDNYIFFYLDKNRALILPKYILNLEERERLKDLIINSKIEYRLKKFK